MLLSGFYIFKNMLAKVNKTTVVLKPEHLKLQQDLFLQYTQCIPKYQQPRKALKT